jgi:hypothetical protein
MVAPPPPLSAGKVTR